MLKKSYYVDGHEKSEQKFHRYKLCEKYLVENEMRIHQWIQYSNEKVDELNFRKIPQNSNLNSYIVMPKREKMI